VKLYKFIILNFELKVILIPYLN